MKHDVGLLIPFYNHGQFSESLLRSLSKYDLNIIIIDDGSDEEHRRQLLSAVEKIKAKQQTDKIKLLHLEKNLGKGGAVMAGFEVAAQEGLTHVIQIDADCQHDFDQVPAFIQASQKQPDAVICGYPEYDETVPKSRLYPRYITHFWVWVNTLSLTIKDAMCGFRCYPLAMALAVCQRYDMGRRMDFDIDIIVRLYWVSVPIINLPIKVIYHQDSSSHFRLWADNLLISRIHARLFFSMLKRLPSYLRAKR